MLQWFRGGEVELHLEKDKKAMLIVEFRLKSGACQMSAFERGGDVSLFQSD